MTTVRHRLSIHWMSLQEHGQVAGFISILVMDGWDYLDLLDYKLSSRATSIEEFFSNVIGQSVEERLQLCGRMQKGLERHVSVRREAPATPRKEKS